MLEGDVTLSGNAIDYLSWFLFFLQKKLRGRSIASYLFQGGFAKKVLRSKTLFCEAKLRILNFVGFFFF